MRFDLFAFRNCLGPFGWFAITPLIATNTEDQTSMPEASPTAARSRTSALAVDEEASGWDYFNNAVHSSP